MANEVAEKKQTFSVALTESLEEVKAGLPADFNTTRFVNNAVALLNGNDTLQKYAQQYGTTNIKLGMMKGAALGLDFISSEAYLIPYGSKLDFMPSFKGSVKIAKKYSIRPVKEIYAKVVREGDDFEESIVNGEPSISFKPKAFNKGAIIGAFAVCLYTDGGMIYETMSLDELEAARKQSKAANSPAWKNFTGEMYKKTVLKRLCKHIEIEFTTPEQRQYFDEDMAIATTEEKMQNDVEAEQNTEEFIDVDAVEVVEDLPPFMQEDN